MLFRSAILLVFEKIYSCLFIPNCTQNHLIAYTKYTTSLMKLCLMQLQFNAMVELRGLMEIDVHLFSP